MKLSKGFTLIELIIVIVFAGIITAITSQMIAQGFNSYLNSKNLIEANWEGRLALGRMTRDIHEVRSAADISTASASQFVFVNRAGTSITYSLSGTNLLRNSQTLASGVQSLAFTYYTQNGATTSTASAIRYVLITLNITQNNTNFSLSRSVYLRNVF